MLSIGSKAPGLSLPDKDGNTVTLGQLGGKKIVLYFYSKDNTSGCTKQALAFAAAYEEFKALGAEVVGVSKDSAASHAKFAEKHGLPFVLLSDTELAAIKAYDVWKEKKSAGKVTMGTVRTTYVIEDGVIVWAKEKVKPDTDPAEVLGFLRGAQD